MCSMKCFKEEKVYSSTAHNKKKTFWEKLEQLQKQNSRMKNTVVQIMAKNTVFLTSKIIGALYTTLGVFFFFLQN